MRKRRSGAPTSSFLFCEHRVTVMNHSVEKTKLLTDLTFIEKIITAIEDAVDMRQQELQLPTRNYLSHDLEKAVNTLRIRKVGIHAKLRRLGE